MKQQERKKVFKCPTCSETKKLKPYGLRSEKVLIECGKCKRCFESQSARAFELFRDKVEKRIAREMAK